MKRTLKDRLMGVVIGILIGATMVTTAFATTGKIQKYLDYNNIKITLDGKEVVPKDANGKYVEPFAIEGTTYLPVRAISSALGLNVGWDGTTNTVILENPHQYDDGTVTITATCNQIGSITYKCLDCGHTKTETIPALQHEFDNGTITTAATCEKNGIVTFSCKSCGNTKTETIPALQHEFDNGTITTAATCEKNGIITFRCKSCGNTKTETVPKLEHKPNANNICDNCGYSFPVELSLTAAEIQNAKKVHYISERDIDNLENEKRYRLMFSLLDKSENFLKVPVIVEIQIKNSNDEIVYNTVRTIYTEDYSSWKNSYGKAWTAAAVYIDYEDILPGTAVDGSITFKVYNDYINFDPTTLTISNGLPLAQSTIILPQVPTTIYSYNYDNSIESSVKITNITYTIDDDDLYIYFTGEKTYDEEGSKYSRGTDVGWKLYDSEGYVIDSGTFHSTQLAVGEKFRNEKEYAFDVIEPGKTYRIEILDVD